MQATVTGDVAALAWVVGTAYQGQGYAGEAAQAARDHLQDKDIEAHIHPRNLASQAVARKIGLHPTEETIDGETVWRASR